MKWPGLRLTPNQTKRYWIWQIIDESSNMIHYSTRQQSTSQPDFTATDKVDQTEDNILEHPICKWPRGSKKWLICNVFKTLVENCKFTVTMTSFLCWYTLSSQGQLIVIFNLIMSFIAKAERSWITTKTALYDLLLTLLPRLSLEEAPRGFCRREP